MGQDAPTSPRSIPCWCFNAPVTQANRAEVMITLAVPSWRQDFKPRLQAKICSDCHGLTIETRLTIEHVYQCAAFQSLVACASGWEAMAQRDNRCSCKKNERIFLCQTASSSWVLGAFWAYYKMDILKLITQNDFWFFKLLRAPRSLFLVYKLGLKKWLKRAFENHFDEKNKINPVLINVQHLFCSEKAYPRPGTL